jgi:hypothetical protein
MHPDFPTALLTPQRNKVRTRAEDRYWDYKEQLLLIDPYAVADFAKDVLAFHNTEGGVLVVGVTNDYAANGITSANILDKKQLRDKLGKFCDPTVDVFQNAIELPNGKFIWLIFVRKYLETPQSAQSDGPYFQGRNMFNKGQYFYRDGDEVKQCRSDNDIERVFRGFSNEHIGAYNYEVDQPYYRLLHPNCEKFVGRKEKVVEIKHKLEFRNPVVALDGLGGVGKTAIAIQAVHELYQEGRYLFIASLSAKSKMWLGHVSPREASFAGLHGLLTEIADVIPDIQSEQDTIELKRSLVSFMKDMNGLILVDNLEEINDDGVFKFLSEEIPEPVKVLVTSRIAKDLGARTIPIPAMTADEAKELLALELGRLGCEPKKDDHQHQHDILEAAGGVPLAIKWAAQLASERRSLREASSILRGAGPGKQEFLSFCFATMYDSLSDSAKDAARLIPYLDREWRPTYLSAALDISVDSVRTAIYELADKGIIYRTDEHRDDDYAVLPLTREFLSKKWNEGSLFRKETSARLDKMFECEEGWLLDWPEDRRVSHLTMLARKCTKNSEHQRALKLVKMAQSSLGAQELWSFEVTLRFLEGQNLYMTDKRTAGIAHMRQAVLFEGTNDILEGNDLLFFAEALFCHGGQATEKEACQAVGSGIQRHGILSKAAWESFIDCSLKRNEIKPIAKIVASLQDVELLSFAFDRLGKLLIGTAGYTYEEEWAIGLARLISSPLLEESTKARYQSAIAENRRLLARINRNAAGQLSAR